MVGWMNIGVPNSGWPFIWKAWFQRESQLAERFTNSPRKYLKSAFDGLKLNVGNALEALGDAVFNEAHIADLASWRKEVDQVLLSAVSRELQADKRTGIAILRYIVRVVSTR